MFQCVGQSTGGSFDQKSLSVFSSIQGTASSPILTSKKTWATPCLEVKYFKSSQVSLRGLKSDFVDTLKNDHISFMDPTTDFVHTKYHQRLYIIRYESNHPGKSPKKQRSLHPTFCLSKLTPGALCVTSASCADANNAALAGSGL